MIMKQSVIFIEGKQSFINQAIATKLTDAGFDVYMLPDETEEIEAYRNEADLILYCPDGSNTHIEYIMQYMAKLCHDGHKSLSLVGDETMVQLAQSMWKDGHIAHIYLRPVNVNSIVSDMLELTFMQDEFKRTKDILLVDDDNDFLTVMKRWLRDTYHVEAVRSGIEALRYLETIRPDLILLDYEMPGLNGCGLMEILRDDVTLSKIPIIFLTGKNDRNSVMQVINRKPDGYILKTMKKEELLETLDRFFTDSILTQKKHRHRKEARLYPYS